MKILMVTEWYPEDEGERFTGGVETRTYYLSRELVKLGHEVVVICRRRKGEGKWQSGGVEVVRCGIPGGEVAVGWRSMLGRLVFATEVLVRGLKVECDLVEGSNYTTYIPAWILGKLKGVPVVAWWPDVLIGRWKDLFGVVGYLWEMVERISLSLSWCVILPISNTTGCLLEERGVEKEKIYPIYLGVDVESLRAVKAKKRKRPTVITIARLVGYKRVGDLIKAISNIKYQTRSSSSGQVSKTGITYIRSVNTWNDLELVIVGEGPERGSLDGLVRDLEIENSVKFYENLERKKLLQLLKSSRAFCLPSEVEGFGLVLLEAAAAGVPYVAADIPAVREITHGGKGGFLYPVGHVGELAGRITELLVDGSLYKRKVEEGRKLVRGYSWEKCAKETARVYERILNFEVKKAKLKVKSHS